MVVYILPQKFYNLNNQADSKNLLKNVSYIFLDTRPMFEEFFSGSIPYSSQVLLFTDFC